MASAHAPQGGRGRERRRAGAPTLYLVRHGETERSAAGAYSGRRDVPLTDRGREQAERAGAALRGAGIGAIHSSPLSRALETARAIAAETGAPVERDDRLTEVDYGPLEGHDRESAAERFGEPFLSWREDPFGSPMPGTEPLSEALGRVGAAISDAIEHSEHPVIVGHQGSLRLALIALGRIEPERYFQTRIGEAQPIEVSAPRVAARVRGLAGSMWTIERR